MDSATLRRPGRWAPLWLVLVGIPTAYILLIVVAGCIDGIANVGGASVGTTVGIVALGAAPFVTCAVAYRATRDRFPRKACAALYATSFTLFVAVFAVAALLALSLPFI